MRPRRGPFEPPRRPEPQTRINDAIRVPRVRLIDGGTDLGIKTTDEARQYVKLGKEFASHGSVEHGREEYERLRPCAKRLHPPPPGAGGALR